MTWDIQPSGDPMSAPTINFDDGAVYERMMGKWSGLAGRAFIDWLSPLPNLRWEGLHALWTRVGFADIEARVLRTRRTFDDFEDYWSTTIAAPNLAPMLTTMATADVTQLKSRVREQVAIGASGRVSIEARANAIVGRRAG